jgi:hypothetical protein
MNKKATDTITGSRKDPRYPQLSELSMTYEGFSEDVILRAPDLSPHGMFVNTNKDFAEGSVLKLRFRLSRSGILVQTRCEVRFCMKGVGVGVEFVGISPEFVRAIEEEIGMVTQPG